MRTVFFIYKERLSLCSNLGEVITTARSGCKCAEWDTSLTAFDYFAVTLPCLARFVEHYGGELKRNGDYGCALGCPMPLGN
jgi:hypothetical protein